LAETLLACLISATEGIEKAVVQSPSLFGGHYLKRLGLVRKPEYAITTASPTFIAAKPYDNAVTCKSNAACTDQNGMHY